MNPTDAATYERARRLANVALWTSAIQRRRLSTEEPEDAKFPLRARVDFDLFVVALSRLRRAAVLALKVGSIKPKMKDALGKFDAAVPHLKTMRDVAEHIDDYAIDSGRDSTISRRELEVSIRTGDTWEWLGHTIEVEKAFVAAVHLFEALKACASEIRKEPNQSPESTASGRRSS